MERDSATQGFLRGFETGRRAKMDRDRFKQEEEDRKLQRQKYKLEMDRLKIQDAEEARKAAFTEAEHYRSLEEPPDTEESQQLPFGMGERTTTTPGRHPAINVPAGGYGQPATTIQPPGMRQLMAQRMLEEKQKRTRTVPAGTPGLPAGDYDSDVLREVGHTSRSESTRRSIEKEGAANRRTQVQVASIYANANKGGLGGGAGDMAELQDDPQVMSYVKLLNSGEATLSQVPSGKQGRFMRDKVVKVLTGLDLAIMTPKMQEKLSQFIPAQAAVDSLEQDLNEIENSEGAVDRGRATMNLMAHTKALARHVGRSLGEKGVFTDQDRDDFASLLQPGGGGFITGIAANVAPKFSRDRLQGARAIMDRVKKREFGAVLERTGGRALPGMGGNTPGAQPKKKMTAEEYLAAVNAQQPVQ